MAQRGIPCLWMRGGTSKAACFLADDLPADPVRRDAVLLAVMGSPDPRQIDGIGGADPLTSKVAIIRRSARPDADVDYLFAQVNVAAATVDYGQNCGNILAAVGPFAIERGLVRHDAPLTRVRIFMENTGQLAVAEIPCDADGVDYVGESRIDGVPGSASPILLHFLDVAGSSCGALLPTGRVRDRFDGVEVTCIDNGMPVILLRACDLGCTGYETREQLDNDDALKRRPGVDSPAGRAADAAWRRQPAHGAQDDPDRRAATRRRHQQPHLYPPPLPRVDRRIWRGERGQRLSAPRLCRAGPGAGSARRYAAAQRRASDRRI